MKIKQAIKALKMMLPDDEVELVFPNCIDFDRKSTVPKLSEGAMAELSQGGALTAFRNTEADDWSYSTFNRKDQY